MAKIKVNCHKQFEQPDLDDYPLTQTSTPIRLKQETNDNSLHEDPWLNKSYKQCIHSNEVLDKSASFSFEGDSWFAQHLPFLDKIEERSTLCEPRSSVTFYGLPVQVKSLYQKHRGIEVLYDWQNECLMLPALQQQRNLIYSLPTSGGKTLVAEILILKEIICKKKNALFILPYVSIVQEKVRSLSPFALELGFLVEEYAAGKGQLPPKVHRKKNVAYVATFEKAHSIINTLIEAKRLHEIGLVVVDELHMIGETGGRGATLECLLAKLMFIKSNIQIIGMSATLGNLDDLKQFLSAEIYCRDFRPVELKEYVKLGNAIFDCKEVINQDPKPKCILNPKQFSYTSDALKKDPDMLTALVAEVIPGNSCLIFCPTKKWCENLVQMLCSNLEKLFKHKKLLDYKAEEKLALYKAMKDEGAGHICNTLAQTFRYGLAYHHSGLTMDERHIIEEAYINGTLCCLVCTSTLAAGVNLPARRVIIRSPYVGNDFLTRSRYKQMVGRAGRAGIDMFGESILIVSLADQAKVSDLLKAPIDVCESKLNDSSGSGLEILLLNLISLEISTSTKDIASFFSSTLFGIQSERNHCDYQYAVTEALQNLHKMKLVRLTRHDDLEKLEVTKIGRACVRGCVTPKKANVLYQDLKKAAKCMGLSNHLHLLYLVTPYDMLENIAVVPDIFFRAYMALKPNEQEVAEIIGVTESIIVRLASGRLEKGNIQDNVHRFFLTLVLYDLWRQMSVWDVASKYCLQRGTIQSLLSGSVTFASCVARFCEELDEFWCFQDLFPNFIKQLSYCVTKELIPLMELPAVRRSRARQLYAAGFRTLIDVAQAQPETLWKKIDHLSKKVAVQMIAAAKMLIKEKAESLQEEAEDMIFNLTSHSQTEEMLTLDV